MASDPTQSDDQKEDSAVDQDLPEDAVESPPAEKNFSPDELPDNGAQNLQPEADINLDLILDVQVNVSLQVGSTEISIRDLVQLVEGSVVALDRDSSEPMDVMVNGTLIAHGEIVVIDDKFGVRLTDVVSPAERIRNIN